MTRRFSTFHIGNNLYGIDVMKVQEVTRSLPRTRVPLAPGYVHGLINLRGQIATAVGLRELFELSDAPPEAPMNVVCRSGELLLAFLVDRVGDVMEVEDAAFEEAPDTVPGNIRRFMEGVYKIPGSLLSVIEVERISEFITQAQTKNN
jgi:purine-binding chemotaxis protein CheW